MEVIGEIDLFLEDGDFALLTEMKTLLEEADIKKHIERVEKYHCYANARSDKRKFVAAAAGAVVNKTVKDFAHQNGLYIIVQSSEMVQIMSPPKGFQAKQW